MRKLFLIPIFALLVCSAASCKKKSDGAAPGERPPASVTVAEASARDVPVYIEEIGKCAPYESVMIQPQITGRITQIHFADGADLKKGDLLFTIDPRPQQAALAQMQAAAVQREAELELAKNEFARIASVIESKAVTRQDYDAKKSAVAVAEAAMKWSQAAIETAQINLDYCTIRSPIDGRAGQRGIDVGTVLKANEGSLLMIQRVDPIHADFTLAERSLPLVRKHMADGSLKVQVWLADSKDTPRDGELTFMDNTVREGSGSIKLRATLKNTDRYFWPGQFVRVRLVLETKKDAVLIPTLAAQVGQTGPYVYVVTAQSTAELRPVTLGQRQDDWVVIESGLAKGEKVVTTGQMLVAPGGKVTVLPATTGGTGS